MLSSILLTKIVEELIIRNEMIISSSTIEYFWRSPMSGVGSNRCLTYIFKLKRLIDFEEFQNHFRIFMKQRFFTPIPLKYMLGFPYRDFSLIISLY
eukprot:UN01904